MKMDHIHMHGFGNCRVGIWSWYQKLEGSVKYTHGLHPQFWFEAKIHASSKTKNTHNQFDEPKIREHILGT